MFLAANAADAARRRARLFQDTFRDPDKLTAVLERAFSRPAKQAEMFALTQCARKYISAHRRGSQREHYRKARGLIENMRDTLRACAGALCEQWEALEQATGGDAPIGMIGDDELERPNINHRSIANIPHVMEHVRNALALGDAQPVMQGLYPLEDLAMYLEVAANRLDVYLQRFNEANGITSGRPTDEACSASAFTRQNGVNEKWRISCSS